MHIAISHHHFQTRFCRRSYLLLSSLSLLCSLSSNSGKKKSLVTGLKRDKKNVFFFFFINFVALGNVEHGKFYRLENLRHPCLGARQILR
ncbi:unnamed protein product [Musa acuminata subsp. malaccensis]|uniref:(wild Malaysian banana) hypothetical protein n=1 Tax=Musa acuminata subsp. malaccensis TaxID=214687 RepID=A0A804IRC4_MUSAM|nr:unnamed protein product [Musa acuminata subsp. malaccensis]